MKAAVEGKANMNQYLVPRRQRKHYLDGELAAINAAHELAQVQLAAAQAMVERKMTSIRQVGQHGMAQTVRVRDWLQVIESHNPDAAPAAAVHVRIAENAMIALALEFESRLS